MTRLDEIEKRLINRGKEYNIQPNPYFVTQEEKRLVEDVEWLTQKLRDVEKYLSAVSKFPCKINHSRKHRCFKNISKELLKSIRGEK